MTPPDDDNRPLTDAELGPEFWNGRYLTNETGWDLGQPSPPFVALHEAGRIVPCDVVIPGCGTGWEVAWLAARGYRVTGIDFAPEALARTRARLDAEGADAELVSANLLAPPESLWGRFDLLLEQTCFCAIDPIRRGDYVTAAWRMLRPGGRLLALFYAHGKPGGPPYHTDPEEVAGCFGERFELHTLELTRHSHERRQGEEWLGELVRR
ncbi:MAG: TPMT family class I SAM-dependent methyltransferase [Nitrospirota bacterium]|nr:TPMT family class I SAM-dependent methyltransferase [Nitrospirota bacterium]